MKPPRATCTTRWKPGVVTRIQSLNNVEVDGIPRHVRDIRACPMNKERKKSEHKNDEKSGPLLDSEASTVQSKRKTRQQS